MLHREYPAATDREVPVGSVEHGRALVFDLELEADQLAEVQAEVASCSDVERLRELVYVYADTRDGYRRASRRVVHHIENAHARILAGESLLAKLRAVRREQ